MMPRLAVTFWLGAVIVGCGEEAHDDVGLGFDASGGASVGADATRETDAGPSPDAAVEADIGAVDAGLDAGHEADAGMTEDAGTADAGEETDGGSDMCPEPAPAPFVDLVEATNAERALYDAPPLCWDDELADDALEYGEGCVWAHDPTREFRDSVAGENLAASTSPSATPASLNQLWIDEKTDWSCAQDRCDPGAVCGHYTQVIWGDSGLVGCGLVACPSGTGPFGGRSWTFLVCRYYPPGNWIGRRPVPVESCP